MRTAVGGMEALESIEDSPPDIVVTDLRMPRLDGHGLMRRLRSRPKRLPVIVLTGHGSMDDAVKALRNGASGFLEKPFRFQSLHASIAGALAEWQKGQGVVDPNESPDSALLGCGDQEPAGPGSEKRQGLVAKVKKRLQSGTLDLPVAAPVLLDLQRSLQAPYTELQAIADIVEQDQEVAIRVMQWANSASHTGKRGVKNLPAAVRRVGLRSVFSIAVRCVTDRMSRQTQGGLYSELAEEISRRTLLTALAARLLSETASHPQPEDLYALALLSEVGEPFLLTVMADVARDEPEPPSRTLVETELARYHAEFGAVLLRRWGFGKEMCDAASLHHKGKAIAELHRADRKSAWNVLLIALARNAAESILEERDGTLVKGRAPASRERLLKAVSLTMQQFDRVVADLRDPTLGTPTPGERS